MTMRLLPYLCALLLGVGAAVMAGCGDRGNLIPSSNASSLTSELSAVKSAVSERDCGKVEAAISRARSAVDNLPDGVDTRLKSRLKGGLGKLSASANSSCAAPPATTTETAPTTETTAPQETTTTDDTAPATPTDPSTTTEQTDPSTPVDPTTTDPTGGATPTDPSTTDPTVPDPSGGGVTPGDGTGGTGGTDGTGFRAAPGDGPTELPVVPQRHRRHRGSVQGYVP